mmetsp:Transcript_7990/g.17266  ORF Transcript_7990/g.17266 Transcript_7990/m.17266 type:complete len:367 (+) Transcript_7990:90-1190(+)|eukprot:CAMPEP_0170573998 /NCGR_PEP_ID=MMETSP0224-20130122/3065_1 /TAXON_ID=285029 /ORGANISM="Togula jolla, Strain CCCM 725" /LENGTH=366 /DNA_ID=CAMNT_0010896625 /DNA_START=52 /DNA_END=1152 /DNA_ORIENTATION=-
MAGTLRWGILSTANIGRKNWAAIRNSGNGILIAVASRDLARAQNFIDDCQQEVAFDDAPRAMGSYDELVAADDVDALYIPLPTGLRKEWVIKAAQAKKHVLCEKPCAKNAEDLQEMIKACAENKVQFMDGIMCMHSDRMAKIREALDDPECLGKITRISSGFSFCASPQFMTEDIRLNSDLEPAGALGDLGWYNIRATLVAMKHEMPRSVRATLLSSASRADSPAPVSTEFSAELFFANGTSASFYNSFLTEFQQWLHVSGSKGNLRVDDFVVPYAGGEIGFCVAKDRLMINGCKFVMENRRTDSVVQEHGSNDPNAQESKLFRNFAVLALGGIPDAFWPEASLKTQRILDACLKSAHSGGSLVEL